MSRGKAERLLNLHIMLLGATRYVSKDAIRRAHYTEYPQDAKGDAAFERAFERDKDDLRAIGAVIDVGSNDTYFEDELGYRIPSEQTSLPQVRLEADEAAVLGVAARVWDHETLAKAADGALVKLSALGIEIDPSRLDVVPPAIEASGPVFDAFWEATQSRRVARFTYRRPEQPLGTERRIEPWGVVRTSGRWYVVGRDLDRGSERVFRLSRVVGDVKVTGKSYAYEIPPGTDVRELAARVHTPDPRAEAVLLVAQGAGGPLRRRALGVETDAAPPPGAGQGGTWDRVRLEVGLDEAADLVLAHAPHVYAVSPPELRERVLARLGAAVEEDR